MKPSAASPEELCAAWSRSAYLLALALRRSQIPPISRRHFLERERLPIAYAKFVKIESGAARPTPAEAEALCRARCRRCARRYLPASSSCARRGRARRRRIGACERDAVWPDAMGAGKMTPPTKARASRPQTEPAAATVAAGGRCACRRGRRRPCCYRSRPPARSTGRRRRPCATWCCAACCRAFDLATHVGSGCDAKTSNGSSNNRLSAPHEAGAGKRDRSA